MCDLEIDLVVSRTNDRPVLRNRQQREPTLLQQEVNYDSLGNLFAHFLALIDHGC